MFVLPPLLLALGASAATFTVFDVPFSSGAPEASVVSVKPLGVGSDGTTYEIAQAIPTGGPTLHQTVVANSAGIKGSASPQEGLPVGVSAACSWGADNNGACVAEVFNAAATQTVTYSGSIVPIFTVTVDDSSAPALPTGAGGAGTNSPPPPGAGGAGTNSPPPPGAGGAGTNSPPPPAGSSTPVIGSASPTSNEAATSPSPTNAASRTLVGSRLYVGMAAVFLLYLL
ncbi:hypothetical protein EYR40_007608 [Pleurotus pulmonarius]|nr:hypothetical protein EYR38_008096 [Pleurotus pulmonarius]KAF4597157.1 hypothetical protein EYR40_007608 [Pleurotus pulmonarius]